MWKRSILLGLPWLVLACDAPPPDEAVSEAEAAPALSVYVGSYPLQYFAERIGGARVEAVFPAPRGLDPAVWSPEPEVVIAYQEADLILLNGAEYEGWTETAALPASRTVDTSSGFEDRIIYVEDAITHSHGPEGEHTHGETASVTWLDLTLALRQAEAVRDALIQLEPASAEVFREGFYELATDLRALDEALETALARFAGERLLAATPAYHYLARRHGLEVESLRFDPAEPLSHDFWHDLEHALGHGTARVMLWEEDPPGEVRERLASLGIEPLVVDPAGARPVEGDFLTVMAGNRMRIEAFGD